MLGRRLLITATAAAATVMVASSAAWACTIFKGTETLVGNSVTAGTSTAIGAANGMNYCSVTPGANAKNTAGTVTVTMTAGSGCSTATLAGNTTYYVNYYNGDGFDSSSGSYGWVFDCMNTLSGGVPPGVNQIGSKVTTAGGTFAATTFNLPPSTNNITGEDSAVCVTDSTGGIGNQAPLHIVST